LFTWCFTCADFFLGFNSCPLLVSAQPTQPQQHQLRSGTGLKDLTLRRSKATELDTVISSSLSLSLCSCAFSCKILTPLFFCLCRN
jgi:hypothetical protein